MSTLQGSSIKTGPATLLRSIVRRGGAVLGLPARLVASHFTEDHEGAGILFVHVAIAWIVLASADLLLAAQQTGTYWHMPELSVLSRLGLAAYDIVAAVPVAVILGLLSGGLHLIRRRRLSRGFSVLGLFGQVLLGVAATAVIVAFVSSWASYRMVGQFLDSDGIALWAASPLQILQHLTALNLGVLVAAVAAILLAVLIVSSVGPRVVEWIGFRGRHLVRMLSLWGVSGSLVCSVVAGVHYSHVHRWLIDHDAGFEYIFSDLYATARNDRVGAFAHAVADVRDRFTTVDPLRYADRSLKPSLSPVLTMASYGRTVSPSREHHYNVVVVTIESLRADVLTENGSKRVVMPSVEQLAASGRVFTDAYSTSSHSNYAQPAILSSQYPLRARRYYVYGQQFPYPRVLIYDILKSRGYRTGIFSSQNEHWGGMYYFLQTGNVDRFLHSDTFTGPTYVPRNDPGFASFIKGSKRSGKIDDRYTIDEAIKWIDERPSAPFFMSINLQNTHTPYERPADFAPRFGSGRVSFAVNFGTYPRDSVPAVRDLYDNAAAYVDAQLGRLFSFLRERKLLDSTLVVVTGDHGEAFFEHGFAMHAGPVYDEVMRVPMVIAGPGVPAGLDSTPFQHVDVPPTLLGLLGLPPHPAFQGEDMLAPGRRPHPMYMVAQSMLARQYAVVDHGFKLIYDGRRDDYALYDLKHDPGERHDLARTDQPMMLRLSSELDDWREEQLEYYDNAYMQANYYPPRLFGPQRMAEAPH